MIITCPACTTRYYAGETSLGNRARKVRCAKCGHRWSQEPEPGSVEPETETPEPAPAAEAAPIGRIVDSLAETESDDEGPAAPVLDVAAPAVDHSREPIDIYASEPEYRPRRVLDQFATVVLALMILTGVVSAAVQYRTVIVRAVPALAGAYAAIHLPVNAVGLDLRNTHWMIETREGKPALVVTVDVVNVAPKAQTIPRLQFTVHDNARRALYQWTDEPGAGVRLGPGESRTFTVANTKAPGAAHDVEVRFLPPGS